MKHKLTALLFIGLFPLNILHATPISLECTRLDIAYVSVMHINLDTNSEHVSVEYSGRQDTIKYHADWTPQTVEIYRKGTSYSV